MKDKNFSKMAFDEAFELVGEMTDAKEILTTGNSFFDKFYFGTRILILAPKPGDEILIAGSTILSFAKSKAEIFIAYSMKKTISKTALKVLGVDEDKIKFFDGKQELKNLLLDLMPNVIFCGDYDSQVEFKNLSADFEGVLGEILHDDQFYRPEVYKKFACATALNSPPDFYAPNLLSTKRPKVEFTDGYNFDLIDCVNYSWKNRVRFPVIESCQKSLLRDNPLSIAISEYESLRNDLDKLKILNGDEVFFERRTDNQAYIAKFSDGRICDFKILEVAKNKQASFEWQEGVQVKRIVIYGNFLDEQDAEIEITLELDNLRANIDESGVYLDKTYKLEKILPKRGKALIIDTEKIFVNKAEIKAVKCSRDFGIAEVEFFANIYPMKKIQPFIKLFTGENFMYNYVVPLEVKKILLELYRFHVEEPVKITAEVEGEKLLTKILLYNDTLTLNLDGIDEIILTAEVVGNPSVYDKIIIRRVGDVAQIQYRILQWLDKVRFLTR